MSRNYIIYINCQTPLLEEMSLVQEAVSKAFSAQKDECRVVGKWEPHVHWHITRRRRGEYEGHGLNGRGGWWVPA